MMKIINLPLFTDTYQSFREFKPVKGSLYIYSINDEERSTFPSDLGSEIEGVDFVQLLEKDYSLTFVIQPSEFTVSVRNPAKLIDFINELPQKQIYIDITGMRHKTWAPLVRSALKTEKNIFCVYSEPRSYRFSDLPREGKIFDLSEKITGIAPIPGFLNLREFPEEKICFIPLLGFEGARFRLILETEQPGPEIIPIIGVPGFQLEYPFYSMLGNKGVLEQRQMWKDIKFSAAHCPFSTLYLLERIAQEHQGYFYKIAPIGTKPHALAAVLFAIKHSDVTELIYDHPKPKPGRTIGQSKVHIYNISGYYDY